MFSDVRHGLICNQPLLTLYSVVTDCFTVRPSHYATRWIVLLFLFYKARGLAVMVVEIFLEATQWMAATSKEVRVDPLD